MQYLTAKCAMMAATHMISAATCAIFALDMVLSAYYAYMEPRWDPPIHEAIWSIKNKKLKSGKWKIKIFKNEK